MACLFWDYSYGLRRIMILNEYNIYNIFIYCNIENIHVMFNLINCVFGGCSSSRAMVLSTNLGISNSLPFVHTCLSILLPLPPLVVCSHGFVVFPFHNVHESTSEIRELL